jgi:hypothetical protein
MAGVAQSHGTDAISLTLRRSDRPGAEIDRTTVSSRAESIRIPVLICLPVDETTHVNLDSRMRDDCEKLMNARPGNSPLNAILRELFDQRSRRFVPLTVASMCVNQDIGVDSDQLPRSL